MLWGVNFTLCFYCYNEGQFSPKKDVNTMELYSRSEAAAMLGITVRKLDELRARRLIGYYQRCPGGKYVFYGSLGKVSATHREVPKTSYQVKMKN